MFFVDEFFRGNEYRLALIFSLTIFACWSFLIFKIFSLKTILRDYWSDLQKHQSMITAATATILCGVLAILSSIIYQESLQRNPPLLQFFTSDQVVITVFVIGTIYVIYEGSRKYRDRISLFGFWSKNITIFSSFMILGDAFVITPFLTTLSFVSPILQMGFLIGLFFSSFDKSLVYLKDIAGLLIIGAIISNSLALSLGWGGSADEVKSVMQGLLKTLEDSVKEKVEMQKIIDSFKPTSIGLVIPQELFVTKQFGDVAVAVSQNYTWINSTRETFHNAVKSFGTLHVQQEIDIKNINNTIDQMAHKSSGISLLLLEGMKLIAKTPESILIQENYEFNGMFYLFSATSTGNTEDYQLAENNMNNLFSNRVIYGNNIDQMYQIYNIGRFVNQSSPEMRLTEVNSTSSLLVIEFLNNSPYRFYDDGYLVLAPQCKYIPTNNSLDYGYTPPIQKIRLEINRGLNHYSIPYKIRNNIDCPYSKESVFLSLQGVITSENYTSSPLVNFRQDLN